MTLWRLEWLRLVRTRRLVALVGVFVFFGLTSPVLARYTGELVQRFGNGVQIIVPAPQPTDGFSSYTSNAGQLGLLVYVLVLASALAFDAQREMAVFLRTRVGRYRVLLLPRFAVTVAAGISAYVLGLIGCWYGTIVLLGVVDAAGVAVGTLFASIYLVFIGAVAAALGARLDSVVTTTVATLAVALALSIAGGIAGVGDWLPSHLLGALTSLTAGSSEAGSYARSSVTALILSAALLVLATRIGRDREL